MKKIAWIAALALLTLTTRTYSLPISLSYLDNIKSIKSYVGADAQVRRMNFKGGYGDNSLHHTSRQGNIYAGLLLDERNALEAGFEATTTRTRTATISDEEMITGTVIPQTLLPAIFTSKAKVKGPYIQLIHHYSIREGYPIKLIGGVGISVFKATSERQTITVAGMSVGGKTRKLSTHKSVVRLTGGLQYDLSKKSFARLTVGWVNTSRMVIQAKDDIGGKRPEVKLKNSLICGLGFGWVF